MIDATLTEPQWLHFGEIQRDAIGDDTRRYLPWLLDDMSEEHVAYILGVMPPPVRSAYYEQWQPAFVDLDAWNTRAGAEPADQPDSARSDSP